MNVEYWTEGGYSIQLPSNTAGSACAPSLTACPASGNLSFPNNHRRHRRLCRAPHGKKSGLFCSCHQSASEGCGYILARRRPGVREVPAAVVGRGASPCLFYSLTL